MLDGRHIISIVETKIIKRVEPFTLKNGELYGMSQDNRL
jgi:hypothetical protein